MSEAPLLLTRFQAAELLQVNERTIRELIASGQLKKKMIGKLRYRIPRAELERYCRTNLTGFHADRKQGSNGNLEREDSVTAAAAH